MVYQPFLCHLIPNPVILEKVFMFQFFLFFYIYLQILYVRFNSFWKLFFDYAEHDGALPKEKKMRSLIFGAL